MTNLTIAVDEDLLYRARVRATEQGTSVNALLRQYLESFAGDRRQREQQAEAFLEFARSAGGRSGGRKWTRDEIHERGNG